tara:strand:+ start:107 stop:1621 length:1515 start_codon:yes stop_codon:yes gene_type:complete
MLKERYNSLMKERSQFLRRAQHNALLTLPAMMPMDGKADGAHLVEPYQGLGAAALVHLSSRMAINFLPAGRPYLRLDLPPKMQMELEGEIPTDITIGLSKSEQMIQAEVEDKGWRKSTLMTLQQLMCSGNVLEYVQPNNTIKHYRLDQYVQRFDNTGKFIEAIIKEEFPKAEIPEGLNPPSEVGTGFDGEENVTLYTQVLYLGKGQYRRSIMWSNDEKVGEDATWDEKRCPYIPLGWAWMPGENYARSKVSEHIADLRSLDALEKAQLEMAAMASRNFILVRPGATAATLRSRITRARNGDVIVADPDSVEAKTFENFRGVQQIQAHIQQLRDSLGRAFLLSSAGQRNAERVTATEIERDISEIEAALGGVFSTLAQDMMKRRTEILMLQMIDQQKLPQVPPEMVTPTILTGLEALSRERDVSRAMQAAQIVQAFGPEAVDVVKLERVIGKAFIGLGIADSVRSEDEVAQIKQQRQEQAQQQAAMEKLGPEVVKQAGQAAQQGE